MRNNGTRHSVFYEFVKNKSEWIKGELEYTKNDEKTTAIIYDIEIKPNDSCGIFNIVTDKGWFGFPCNSGITMEKTEEDNEEWVVFLEQKEIVFRIKKPEVLIG